MALTSAFRGYWIERSQDRHWRTNLRALVAVSIAVPPLLLVVGFLYSETSMVHGGVGIAAVILPSLLFVALYVVFEAGHLHSAHPAYMIVAIVSCSLGPFLVGHSLNYEATKSWTWDYVQQNPKSRFPAEWHSLGREETFERYVGWATGEEGSGFTDYFRLQAAVGYQGWESSHYQHKIGRPGASVYLQWFWHVSLFLLACGLAFYVTRPKSDRTLL